MALKYMKMKKLLYIAIAFLSVIGCKDPNTGQPGPELEPGPDGPLPPVEETLASKIAGEWHCVVSDIDADIYLSLVSDATFELYQKIGEGGHRLYRGTWTLDEDIARLSGKYNDGNSWASSYDVAVSEDKNSMTLTSADEELTYRRESIPSEVKDGCTVVVRSAGAPVL